MKNLIIINAGKFGREVCAWATQARANGTEWRIKGFLDNRKGILAGFKYDFPILGSAEDYHPQTDDLFVCAIGEPRIKKLVCEALLARGARFTNVIHPTVVMGEHVTLGVGVILCPMVVLTCDVHIGDFVTVNIHSLVAHDAVIESYCQIHGNVSVNGNVRIKQGALLGSNAVLLPNSIVGQYAVVGAGSVVLREVADNQTVFGNPARSLGLPPSSG